MFYDSEVFARSALPLPFKNGFQDKIIYDTRKSTLFFSHNLCFTSVCIIQLDSASLFTRLGCFSKSNVSSEDIDSDMPKDAIPRRVGSGWGKGAGGGRLAAMVSSEQMSGLIR